MQTNIFTAIETDYDGPCLEENKITKKFVDELLPYLKDQKRLHKKYAYQVNITKIGRLLIH